jgi:hypothetical protein
MEPTPSTPPAAPDVISVNKKTFIGMAVALVVVLAIGFICLLTFAVSKPPLPVTVKWREAILDHTSVMIIRLNNDQSSTLRVLVTYRDNSLNQVKRAYVDVHAGQVSVGHLEGFSFLPGDTVELSNARFSSITTVCPPQK